MYNKVPAYPWYQCGILNHLGTWPDLVAMTLCEVYEREAFGAPPGKRVAHAHSVRDS